MAVTDPSSAEPYRNDAPLNLCIKKEKEPLPQSLIYRQRISIDSNSSGYGENSKPSPECNNNLCCADKPQPNANIPESVPSTSTDSSLMGRYIRTCNENMQDVIRIASPESTGSASPPLGRAQPPSIVYHMKRKRQATPALPATQCDPIKRRYNPPVSSDCSSVDSLPRSPPTASNLIPTDRPTKVHNLSKFLTAASGIDMSDFDRFAAEMRKNLELSRNKGTNPNMRRQTVNMQNPRNADPEYLEKRRKNNEAAKKSRDNRRQKEDELAILCTYYEKKMTALSYQNEVLVKDNTYMRHLLSSYGHNILSSQLT